VPTAGRAIGLFRRYDELTTATDLHPGDAVLPALNKPAQRELDGLAAVPRAVELLAGVVLDADVVHFDRGAGHGLGTVADDDVFDDEFSRSRAGWEVDLWLVRHDHHASGHTRHVAEDNDTLSRINALVAEEKELRGKLQRGEISGDEENMRLRALEVQLDQCWDLLRQRRALRETGGDPADAHTRTADQVEGYLN
jgi:Protein of unknown function (DUF2630)